MCNDRTQTSPSQKRIGGGFVVPEGGDVMADVIRVSDATTIDDVLAGLWKCSRYPQSEARTRSTDALLDLMLVWAGVEV